MGTRSKAAPAKRPARTRPAATRPGQPRPVDIPSWPQLKLDIVRRYGAAYSRIASRQPGLAHNWIDVFAGPGAGASAPHGAFVPGSPVNALLVAPPFRHHWLVELGDDGDGALRRSIGDRDDVTLFQGDGDRALLEEILPRVRHDDYRRALCVLDPRATPFDWRVVETAGRLRTIDLFVAVAAADAPGDDAARALKRRLREDAGFGNVLEPLPLRDATGAVVARLCFASRTDTANDVVEDIFARRRDGAARAR